MSDEPRVADGTQEGPETRIVPGCATAMSADRQADRPTGTEAGPARVLGEAPAEADVAGVGADDDLSPWYADIEDDDPDLPPETWEADDREDELPEEPAGAPVHMAFGDEGVPVRRSLRKGRGRRLVRKQDAGQRSFGPEERLLLLDTWRRSGLPAKDFAGLVGVAKHTLYSWKKRFDDQGPAGLMDAPRGPKRGSRLPEVTKRAILMLKEGNPDYGVQRISDMLFRGPGLPASPCAVARVLHEAGYVMEERPTVPHPDKVRSFERARPNQLWQTDIFTFILKRQNRRVYLVAFMDDHSRFVVGYGLHASASSALVLEVFRAAISSYGTPEEVLTDNGSQYITWRGRSAFSKECEKRGIRQIVSRPRHPQTLGKIERFWGTLWRECVEASVFVDLGDARRRIGLFIDHYNFQRVHQGVEGLVPADRFFGAAPEVLGTLRERVAANALDIARNGMPKEPFYLAGNVGGKPVSVYAEGERLVLKQGGAEAREIALASPDVDCTELPEAVSPEGVVGGDAAGCEEPPAPGASPLDEGLAVIQSVVDEGRTQ